MILLICLLTSACACNTPPIEIPVYKRAAPPAELSEWHPGRLPLWIEPNAEASSCLTPHGEQELKNLLHDMKTRIRAWEAWAEQPLGIPE